MQMYPTYSQMNNPYVQQSNPYMDRMAFLQNLQQPMTTQVPGMSQNANVGKMVDSIDVVKATDIPMDGNMYYFPKADGSEIYGKRWIVNEGRTCILTFKPIENENTNNLPLNVEKMQIGLSDDVTEVFLKHFESIEKRLEEIIPKKSTSKTKGE